MWAESSPIGVMAEVMFSSEVQVEKTSSRGGFVSLQVNLYFLIQWTSCCGMLLWELPFSTVNIVRKNYSLITILFLSDQENQSYFWRYDHFIWYHLSMIILGREEVPLQAAY